MKSVAHIAARQSLLTGLMLVFLLSGSLSGQVPPYFFKLKRFIPEQGYTDNWTGIDKAKHFSVSMFLVTGSYYSMTRPLEIDRSDARISAVSLTIVIGLGKELYDAKRGRPFSFKDLAADAFGVIAGLVIINNSG